MIKKYIDLYARFDDIEQMYDKGTSIQNDNYLLTFLSDKGHQLKVIISDSITKQTKKNPHGLSRLAQLRFTGNNKEYNVGDYLKLKLSVRKANKTEYNTEKGIQKHKSDGIEIKNVRKVNKNMFEEQYGIFIANKYETNIGEKIKEGWSYSDCIEHFKRINQSRDKD